MACICTHRLPCAAALPRLPQWKRVTPKRPTQVQPKSGVSPARGKRERYLRNKRLPERRPSDTGCSMSSTFLRATCSRAKMARGFLRDEKRKRIKLIFSCCIPFSNYKKKPLVELAFSDNVCAFVPVPGIAVKFPFPLPHTLLLFLSLSLSLSISFSPGTAAAVALVSDE